MIYILTCDFFQFPCRHLRSEGCCGLHVATGHQCWLEYSLSRSLLIRHVLLLARWRSTSVFDDLAVKHKLKTKLIDHQTADPSQVICSTAARVGQTSKFKLQVFQTWILLTTNGPKHLQQTQPTSNSAFKVETWRHYASTFQHNPRNCCELLHVLLGCSQLKIQQEHRSLNLAYLLCNAYGKTLSWRTNKLLHIKV